MTKAAHTEEREPEPSTTVAAPAVRSGALAARVLDLQRRAGNRAVARMVAGRARRAAVARAGGGPVGNPPVEVLAPAKPKKPEPRFVAPVPDPQLPRGTDRIVDQAPGPETVLMRDVGNWIHENFELVEGLLLPQAERLTAEPLPEGLEPEYRIPDPNVDPLRRMRPDRVDWNVFEVIEIKPEHRRAQGEAEAAIYAQEMDRFHQLPNGRTWGSRCVTYDPIRVVGFLLEIGYVTPESLGLPPGLRRPLWSYMHNDARRSAPPPPTNLYSYMRPRVWPPPPGSSPGSLYEYMRPGTGPAPSGGGGSQGGARAHLGVPEPPVQMGGLPTGGAARADAHGLVLDMLNAMLGRINDEVQRRDLREAIDALWSEIDGIQRERPDCGVLLVPVYRHIRPGPDSAIRPGLRLLWVEKGVGRDVREANLDRNRRPGASAGMDPDWESNVDGEPIWIPAPQPVDPPPPPPPWPAVALATFSSRTPTLTDVRWQVTPFGFDDAGETTLTVPEGMEPRFHVLKLPRELTARVRAYSETGAISQDTHGGLPVARLDVYADWWSPEVAAAIFPADAATSKLLQQAPATSNYQVLVPRRDSYDLVRWISPEQIEVVEER